MTPCGRCLRNMVQTESSEKVNKVTNKKTGGREVKDWIKLDRNHFQGKKEGMDTPPPKQQWCK